MAKLFTLDFHGAKFSVPKGNLIDLFERHTELVAMTSYDVQSSVPLGIFEIFVKALETGGNVPVTKENAGAISLLAHEFGRQDLISECCAVQALSTPEPITDLSERISKLEHSISSQVLALIPELRQAIANHERQLHRLHLSIEANTATVHPEIQAVSHSVQLLQTDLAAVKSKCERQNETLIARMATIEPRIIDSLNGVITRVTSRLSACEHRLNEMNATPVPVSASPKTVTLPIKQPKSLDGIISYLTRKHGGNVHDKGVVTITSKSVGQDDPMKLSFLADLTSDSWFFSKNEPGQWVCWDFHEMRIRPTHYTIRCGFIGNMKSWVVESSLDGESWFSRWTWTEIDRKTDNNDLNWAPGETDRVASFALAKTVECRFIRLTQTGKSHFGTDELDLWAFEVFGTLTE